MSDELPASDYPVVMSDIALRIAAASDFLSELESSLESRLCWKNVDFIALQVRKICELIVLGSTFAHMKEGNCPVAADKWHPKECLSELSKFNDVPLPVPIAIADKEEAGEVREIRLLSQPMPPSVLATIYGKCGNFVHIGSANQVRNGKIPSFDVQIFRGWLIGFEALLSSHLLMLPELQTLLLCRWSGSVKEQPTVWLLSGQGPSVFDTSNLPEFGLLAP